jgi:hypothetical protein
MEKMQVKDIKKELKEPKEETHKFGMRVRSRWLDIQYFSEPYKPEGKDITYRSLVGIDQEQIQGGKGIVFGKDNKNVKYAYQEGACDLIRGRLDYPLWCRCDYVNSGSGEVIVHVEPEFTTNLSLNIEAFSVFARKKV